MVSRLSPLLNLFSNILPSVYVFLQTRTRNVHKESLPPTLGVRARDKLYTLLTQLKGMGDFTSRFPSCCFSDELYNPINFRSNST